MTQFIAFALYLCLGTLLLIFVPVMMAPGLSGKRKLLICAVGFLILVPGGLALYAYLGVPPMGMNP